MTSTATLPPAGAGAPAARRSGEVDNRAAYAGFGLAYVLGHGAAAASHGETPLLGLPGWLPMTLLGTGVATGIILAATAALRAQRAATAPELHWVLAVAGGGAYSLAAALERRRLRSLAGPPQN
ncbi:hypothetical protein [Streptomyces sp. 147326]|uniref:hypothetical protein n=1 Tax=Streptomyces sp. 147326 TaxID=3074379 RepID=UPI003857DDB0